MRLRISGAIPGPSSEIAISMVSLFHHAFTSTAALMRNFCTGTVVAISGFLIKWTGSYIVAFWFGFALSSIAVVVFFIFRRIMRSGHTLQATAAEKKEETGGIATCKLIEIM